MSVSELQRKARPERSEGAHPKKIKSVLNVLFVFVRFLLENVQLKFSFIYAIIQKIAEFKNIDVGTFF